jgi:hypothetical protein
MAPWMALYPRLSAKGGQTEFARQTPMPKIGTDADFWHYRQQNAM